MANLEQLRAEAALTLALRQMADESREVHPQVVTAILLRLGSWYEATGRTGPKLPPEHVRWRHPLLPELSPEVLLAWLLPGE